MLLRFDSPASASDWIFDRQFFVTPAVTGGGQVTAQVRSARQSIVGISAGGQLLVNGAANKRRFDSPIIGSNYIFDLGDAQSPGGSVSISGGGQIIANGAEGEGVAITVSGGGSTSASGQKGAIGEWFVEYWVNLQTTGEKGAAAAISISAGGQLSAFGNPGGAARVRGGGAVSATPAKGAQQSSNPVGAGGQVTASGTANVPPVTGQASITGGGNIVVFGTRSIVNRQGTARVTGAGGIVIQATFDRKKNPNVAGGGAVSGVASKATTGTALVTGGGQILTFIPLPVKAKVYLLVEPAA